MKNTTAEELRNAFWKADMEAGGIIRTQYEEIKRVIDTVDMQWVKDRYADIKQHAIDHTGFYKGYKANDEFPVMDKMLLLENYEGVKADGGYKLPTHVSSTSGSTGTPFAVIQDYKKRKRTIADLKVFGELCDYPSHERMLFFRVINEKLNRSPEQEDSENIYYIDSSNLDMENCRKMHNAILEKEPRIIFSYSSTLVHLARFIDSLEEKYTYNNLKAVLTGGEGISEENRRLLEKVFDCRVYRRYSNMELGILGQDMGNGGSYLLNYGSYYFECLKTDCDKPAEAGEVGRIVITDLFNLAFPMIRYDTGDLGIIEEDENEGFPRLKEIYGRKRDCVYTVDGLLLSPAKISVGMWGTEGVKQWQFIQETKYDYVLKLNCEDGLDTSSLINKFKALLGADAKIHIEYVDEIPVASSNKRRAVICNYKKEK